MRPSPLAPRRVSLLVPLFLWLALAAGAEERTLTILHTNDMHAQLLPGENGRGGMAGVAACLNALRAGREDVLVLDAGDMTAGSAVSTIFHGKPIFEIMNTMGYDAATLGNHEFDDGHAYVAEFREIAAFAILSANVRKRKDGALLADAAGKVFERNGVRVAVVGLTTSRAVQDEAVRFDEPEETLRRFVAAHREDADLVVALTHLGVAEDQLLAAAVPGVDVFVGWHSHTALKTARQAGDAILVQAGSKAEYVGELRLVLDAGTNRILSHSSRLHAIPPKTHPPHAPTLESIRKWEARVEKQIDAVLGRTPRRISRGALTERVAEIWREACAADFAFHNYGGTRSALESGPITLRDLYRALPFNNDLVILTLTREQVRTVLSDARFREEKPLYTLVTNSYMADIFQKDLRLSEERIRRLGQSVRDPVADYLRTHGVLFDEDAEALEDAA